MPGNCVVGGCWKTNLDKNVSFFRFPNGVTDIERRRLWISFVKLTRTDFNCPFISDTVCSMHFRESDWDVGFLLKRRLLGITCKIKNRPTLSKTAIPSIQPNNLLSIDYISCTSKSMSDQVVELQKSIQLQLQQFIDNDYKNESTLVDAMRAVSQLEQIARMKLYRKDSDLLEEYRLQILKIYYGNCHRKGKPSQERENNSSYVDGSDTGKSRRESKASQEKRVNHSSRMKVIQSVMKRMLNKVDRDEKKSTKREQNEKRRERKRQIVVHQRHMEVLRRKKNALKNEIIIRRALLKKLLTWEIMEEEAIALRKEKKARKRKEKKRKKEEASQSPAKSKKSLNKTPEKEKVVQEVIKPVSPVKEVLIPARTVQQEPVVPEPSADDILYCICQTKYDPSRFYVGCGMCLNWFHGTCVGVDESIATDLKEYICVDCFKKKREREDELYCLCRQPYDETKFYIGCDKCNDRFHGTCVGITKSEAEVVEEYHCPRCNSSNIQNVVASQKTLTPEDYDQLRGVLGQLESHKMGWPFVQPVSDLNAPDYYNIVQHPIDLSGISDKLKKKSYFMVNEFVADMSKMFDNCRLYNASDSLFFQCADVLEKFFVQKIKNFKQ